MLQKFIRGQRVKVCKEMPKYMSHFESDFEAIIGGSYFDKFGGENLNNLKEYNLYKIKDGKVVNSKSWYEENQLTLIDDDIIKGIEMIEEFYFGKE